MSNLKIAVMPGDGIGTEVMDAALNVLSVLQNRFGFRLDLEDHQGGADLYRRTGTALTDESFEAARRADAILFGAMGLPDVRYPDGTEIAPHLEMRRAFHLYAGVRPVRSLPNTPSILADPRSRDIDLVIIRESTEGLFYSRGKGTIEDDSVARETLVITRDTSERLFDFSFRLAERRRERRGREGRVTCVDKSNVFVAMAFFRKIFDERSKGFAGVRADHAYVDAAALDMIRKPWEFDILVMENMFGDILSDLGGGLVGGMGLAPCAEIGDEHALFQPAHGSAPDIVGQGKANPTAMLLSMAMMLDWLGNRHAMPSLCEAAEALDRAVDVAYAEKIKPFEFGGSDGTREIARAVWESIA
ncbi:isocitrate/isopropylmalate dehydrogenase family protein [Aureimonas altamirensis]|uniref:isocitrate/isopropylmalate dehydrogenase family protein n=1 Tax=Aureimonas altamirensis TaxID=370622 RepID=UPI001E487387|nr:isocitrate/isopropylmalate family dehydrogenase [Aureimonas altamirensis]UHD46387.1 isocitrate/isopropylmalate dehydrogenase family protein [Aureimonas altamirensis]